MAICLVEFHINGLKDMGITEYNNENLSVNQTKILKTDLTRIQLIEKIESDPKWNKLRTVKNEDGLVIRTKLSNKSFGEVIKITQAPSSGNGFEYLISRQPKFSLSYIDFGKNTENIKQIENLLSKTA